MPSYEIFLDKDKVIAAHKTRILESKATGTPSDQIVKAILVETSEKLRNAIEKNGEVTGRTILHDGEEQGLLLQVDLNNTFELVQPDFEELMPLLQVRLTQGV